MRALPHIITGQLRELVINAIAVLNNAPYEWYQHAPVSEGGVRGVRLQ